MKKTSKGQAKRTASVSEVKASLSAYLARVKDGEEVVVTERGTPIAKLVPVRIAQDADAQRLLRLAAEGVILPGAGVHHPALRELERPADPDGDVLRELLDERESGW
jgi:prevent-host-death family protein